MAGAGGSLDARRGNGHRAPLHFHLRCAAGDTVVLPSVSSRRRGEVWSESPWGCSAIVDHSVESQCMIIELVSNL